MMSSKRMPRVAACVIVGVGPSDRFAFDRGPGSKSRSKTPRSLGSLEGTKEVPRNGVRK